MKTFIASLIFTFTYYISAGQGVTFEITSSTKADVQIMVQKHPGFEPIILKKKNIVEGKNTFSLECNSASYAILHINGSFAGHLFMEPGKTYGVTIQPDGSAVFTTNGALNATLQSVKRTYDTYRYNGKLYYKLSSEEFADGIGALRKHITDSLSNRSEKLPDVQEQALQDVVKYRFVSQILNFYWGKHRPGHPVIKEVTNQAFYDEAIAAVEINDKFLNNNLSDYPLTLVYHDYLKSDPMTSPMIDSGITVVEPFLDSLYQLTDEGIYPPAVKSFLFAHTLQGMLLTHVPTNFTYYLNDYIVRYPGSPYYKDILEKYNKVLKFSNATEAPKLTVQNVKGNEQEVISTYAGKIIYLDFWATWCGPCVKELPNFTKLKADYKDYKDIVFVKVSVDKDLEKWKSFEVKNSSENAESYVLTLAQREAIIEQYMLQAVPRYMLIGKDGSILSTNAPLPSAPDIKKVLAEALAN